MRSLSILRLSAGAEKSGPILCPDEFWAFMLQVASVQLLIAKILLLPYSACPVDCPCNSCINASCLQAAKEGPQRLDGQNLPAPAGGAIAPPIPQNNQQPPVRTVRDYLAEDLEGLNPGVTTPEFKAEHFELKPVMFNMLNTLDQFGGSPTENARQHLKSFLEICNSFKIHGVSNDVLKLKLFPYSLRDKAKVWLNNLQPGSLQSWTELCRSFLDKFSYTNMTDHLRNQITTFRQEDDKAMHEA
ncbi:hypothetical protein V6N11_044980 [Hibiscus sabdariffa]|uniref:Retrotransposon gag domain-containing protein n=1 Tax=Hibiscus sabdariffa TaxID=183260 RepID=A0ABR2PUQ8_9ROSI